MESKDIWIIILGLLGWSWGVFQFVLKRKYQKKDKLTDKRFDAYTAYMKKSDEMMSNVRTDPDIIYGISTDFMDAAISGDEDRINKALLEFNSKLLNFVKKASEPLLIIKQELNSLRIICSKEMVEKIEEFNLLTTDFNNAMQKSIGVLSTNYSETDLNELKVMAHNDRWKRFIGLNEEIIVLMRMELGSD